MKAKILLPLVLGLPVSALADDLFISEYIEGSSNNKAIEIYNPTDTAIDLTGYRLEIYSNGGISSPRVWALSQYSSKLRQTIL